MDSKNKSRVRTYLRVHLVQKHAFGINSRDGSYLHQQLMLPVEFWHVCSAYNV